MHSLHACTVQYGVSSCTDTHLTTARLTAILAYNIADVEVDRTSGELDFTVGSLSKRINIPARNRLIVQALTHDPPQLGETFGKRRSQLELPRALVFCAGVQHAQDLAEMLNENGEWHHSIAHLTDCCK
jgi:hypothetical protein